MASSIFYNEHLTCPICLSIFTDPVTLTCGHSFCRECIMEEMIKCQECPQCHTVVPVEGACLQTSHILQSLAEKAKDTQKMEKRTTHKTSEVDESLCPDHAESLKLFCVKDLQLACIICRDGKTHKGHKLIPVSEAAAPCRKRLEHFARNIADDIDCAEKAAAAQMLEMAKTVDRAQQLRTQISRQFKEMHQFLRKREDEIKNEVKTQEEDAVKKMGERLDAMETALSESRVMEAKIVSVGEIIDNQRFLQSWAETSGLAAPEYVSRSRTKDFHVIDSSLSLGPFESHLQFFIWKEMLQVINPRAEQLLLKRNSTDVTVSDDGQIVFCRPPESPPQSDPFTDYGEIKATVRTKPKPFIMPAFHKKRFSLSLTSDDGEQITTPQLSCSSSEFKNTTPSLPASLLNMSSVNQFSSGQFYWEVDVGKRAYWALGIQDYFLKCDGQKYSVSSLNAITDLSFTGNPRKIGLYLNCSSKKLSFFNADNMRHIHTLSCRVLRATLPAYFSIRYTTPDTNPMRMCWY